MQNFYSEQSSGVELGKGWELKIDFINVYANLMGNSRYLLRVKRSFRFWILFTFKENSANKQEVWCYLMNLRQVYHEVHPMWATQ